jgi:Ca2+-binding RTX toxin-like protein
LTGLDGNDLLKGGEGNDSLRGDGDSDILDGGNGIDTAQYWNASSSVEVDLSITSQYTVGAGYDTLLNIENLNGSAFNDTLIGNATANALFGGKGSDLLKGNDGNDNLWGNEGNDVLDGGSGVDYAQYWNATAGVIIDLSLTAGQDTKSAGFDTLVNIENINGSAFNDILTGNALNNTLLGGGGNDTLNGGDGNDSLRGDAGDDAINGGNGSDTAHYWNATAGVTVNLARTNAQNTVGAGIDTLLNIENVNGSGFNDILIGNALNNVLLGGGGNDSLNGSLGSDVLTGGQGKDSFFFNSALGSSNKDIITDFTVVDDTIKLENSVFTALISTGELAANAFKMIGNGNTVDSDDHILYNTVTGGFSYDVDGSGSAAAVLVAIIGKGLAVTEADFVVI